MMVLGQLGTMHVPVLTWRRHDERHVYLLLIFQILDKGSIGMESIHSESNYTCFTIVSSNCLFQHGADVVGTERAMFFVLK